MEKNVKTSRALKEDRTEEYMDFLKNGSKGNESKEGRKTMEKNVKGKTGNKHNHTHHKPPRRAYSRKAYGEMTGVEIERLAYNTGYNVLYSKYSYSGKEIYNPANPSNAPTLQDLQQTCAVALWEYLTDNGMVGYILAPYQLLEARKAMYKACSAYLWRITQHTYRHNYIPDADADDIAENPDETTRKSTSQSKHRTEDPDARAYIDVTASLKDLDGVLNVEILNELRSRVWTTRQTIVMRMYAAGNADETIARRLQCSQQNVNKLRHVAIKHARQYFADKEIDPADLLSASHLHF